MTLSSCSTSELPRRIYDPSLATSLLIVSGRRLSPGPRTAAAVSTRSATAGTGSSARLEPGGAPPLVPDQPGGDLKRRDHARPARIQIP
jgi:hypothetical protein